jgi:hypothetical protein
MVGDPALGGRGLEGSGVHPLHRSKASGAAVIRGFVDWGSVI